MGACLAASMIQYVSAYNAISIGAVKNFVGNVHGLIQTTPLSHIVPDSNFPLQSGTEDYYENARQYFLAYMNIDGQCTYNSQISIGNDSFDVYNKLIDRIQTTVDTKNIHATYGGPMFVKTDRYRRYDYERDEYRDTTSFTTSNTKIILERTRKIGNDIITKFEEKFKNDGKELPEDTMIGFSFAVFPNKKGHAISAYVRRIGGVTKVAYIDMNNFGNIVGQAIRMEHDESLMPVNESKPKFFNTEMGFFTEQEIRENDLYSIVSEHESNELFDYVAGNIGSDYKDELFVQVENQYGESTYVINNKMPIVNNAHITLVKRLSDIKNKAEEVKAVGKAHEIVDVKDYKNDFTRDFVFNTMVAHFKGVSKQDIDSLLGINPTKPTKTTDGGKNSKTKRRCKPKTKRRCKHKTNRRRRRKTKHIITI